ncbi:Protein kinase domain-containing protein [Entamoeba marina]
MSVTFEFEKPSGKNILLIFSGSFARVYKACDKRFNRIISLKILNVELDDYNNNVRNVRREVEILKWLNHKNVLKFFEEFISGSQVILVTEHCDGGDLFGKIPMQGMTENDAGYIFLQLLDAVDYLQKKNV